MRTKRRRRDFTELLKCLRQHLDREVSISGHIRRLLEEGSILASEQLSLLLVELLSDLTECDFVEDRALQEGIDAMKTAEHVLPLLFEVDHLVPTLLCHISHPKFKISKLMFKS